MPRLYSKGNSTIRVRRGIDKVLVAVIPSKFKEIKYSRDKALIHAPNYVRLKFGRKKWGSFVFFQRGEWDNTPLLTYYVPLRGFSRVLVTLNLMRYYNYSHGLEFPKGVGLWDNNLVDPSEHFEIDWFLHALVNFRGEILEDAKKLMLYVHGQEYAIDDEASVIVQQIEIPEEGIGLDIVDIKQVYKHTRSQKIEKWSNNTGTVYLNGQFKEQVKFYQKGLGVLRCEFCLNDKSVCLDLKDADEAKLSIEVAINRLCETINIPRRWWELVRYPEKEELYQVLACTLDVRLDLLKRIVECNIWESKASDELLTRKLLRRGLIKKVRRGVYIPSRKLIIFKDMLDTLGEPI